MPLVSMLCELRKAQESHYAVPCFDAFEMLGAEGLFAALAQKRAPGTIGIYGPEVDKPTAGAFAAFLVEMAKSAPGPVALILDHGANLEQCTRALRFGLSDVMFDGSGLDLEDNIAQTKVVVRAAHAVGAGVEAELGHVGRGDEYQPLAALRERLTDPTLVARFVAETGVDALAISIGTAHGVYRVAPELDLPLLQEIRRRVEIPLVLHGGSGLSDAQFRGAIAGGIAKVNVFTDLGLAAGRSMVTAATADKASYFGICEATREAFRERAIFYLDLFGASGRV